MNRSAEFAKSGLGSIPKGWRLVSLKEITELKNGERPLLNSMGGIPIYGANGIMGQSHDSLVNNDYTIIIGRVGASGEIHLARGNIWVSDNAIYTTDYRKQDVFLPFLYFLLCFKDLGQYSTKTTHPIITQSFLNNFRIILPPYSEQKKIAQVLSTEDKAIEKVGEAIEKAQRLKKGLVQELLTKGIGHKESKETEIGRFPRDWTLHKLSDLADVKGGKRLPKGYTLSESRTPFPYIRVVDFKNMSIDASNIRYLPSDAYKLIKKYTISSNDVYVSIAGTVGISGLVPQELDGANLTENAAKLCNLRDVKKEFLANVLDSPIGQKQILSYVGRAQQPKLALFRIGKIKIPLPSASEQQKIARILSSGDKRLEFLGAKLEKLERVKKGLMDDLLTGKKRVSLEA